MSDIEQLKLLPDWELYQLDINPQALIRTLLEHEDLVNSHAHSQSLRYKAYHDYPINETLNTFTLMSVSNDWYKLYEEIVLSIHRYFKKNNIDTQGLWLRTWPAILRGEEEHKSHSHKQWPFAGYVSLDAQGSDTVYTDGKDGEEIYRIKNKPGQMYIGPGTTFHHVEKSKPYKQPRISVGYDIELSRNVVPNEYNFIPIPTYNLSKNISSI